jgi:hypothetical protein
MAQQRIASRTQPIAGDSAASSERSTQPRNSFAAPVDGGRGISTTTVLETQTSTNPEVQQSSVGILVQAIHHGKLNPAIAMPGFPKTCCLYTCLIIGEAYCIIILSWGLGIMPMFADTLLNSPSSDAGLPSLNLTFVAFERSVIDSQQFTCAPRITGGS